MPTRETNESLTEKQIAARQRLRIRSAAVIEEVRARKVYDEQGFIKDDSFDVDAANEVDLEQVGDDASEGIDEATFVGGSIPEGPPWNYDITPEEMAIKAAKRERRAQKTKSLKQSALNKAPNKLKNPSDLQVRFRTALVYTLLTIGCVFGGDITFVLYLMIVAGICAGEFYYMLRSDAKLPNEMLGIAGAVLYIPAVYFLGLNGAVLVMVIQLIALLVWYVFWLKARVADVGISFFGAAYTGLLLCGLVLIRQNVGGVWGSLVLFLLFLSVWANDAFAYFVGSRFGKHKLAPRTSPKKSWEGFIAGLIGSALVWLAMSFIPGIAIPIPLAILFGIICGIAEVIGDLAESRIKRNSGFKDSGTIMPGHGGLLDRCDSLFLASITSAILLVFGGCFI